MSPVSQVLFLHTYTSGASMAGSPDFGRIEDAALLPLPPVLGSY